MKQNIDLDTAESIIKEIDKAVEDKSRVISDIKNTTTREIITSYSCAKRPKIKHALIGFLIGGIPGFFAAKIIDAMSDKNQLRKERLYQEAIKKQNKEIIELKNELQELREKQNKKEEEIKRLEYLVGVLSLSNDVMSALEKDTGEKKHAVKSKR